MSLDRKRITAVSFLEALGYSFDGQSWTAPPGLGLTPSAAADAMHALLIERADALFGCLDQSPEESELMAIGEALDRYEAIRWPNGKELGGKG